jgi:hypothetical protein
MADLKLGFALEGNSDYPVLPVLSRRMINTYRPDLELTWVELRPRKRGHGFVKELPTFAAQLNDRAIDIVVAVVDTDNARVGERRGLLDDAKRRCVEMSLPVCIADGLAVHALEAWLLADETAVFEVFDGDRRLVSFPACENQPNPKDALNSIVRALTEGQEISFVNRAADLAEKVDLQIVRQRCHHFDEFARTLLNCVKEWERLQR